MLVEGWTLRYGEPGRRRRSGEGSRPGREGRHPHLRGGWPVAQRRMGPNRIVVASPALDDDLRLAQRVEDLAVEQLVSKPTSVTPIERIASATGVPCATRTSTWRSLATISSGLCLFLDMDPSSFGSKAIRQDGPLQGGRINVSAGQSVPRGSLYHHAGLSRFAEAGPRR
jgi:hypothetical protein